MRFLGNFLLNSNTKERQTIAPAPGFYPNGTLFKRVSTTDSSSPPVTTITDEVITTASEIDENTLGILMVQPEGVDIVSGDRIDLTAGTIRIDIVAYESARLDEIEKKGSSKMADLSTLLVPPKKNQSITANGCTIQLVHVVR